MSESADQIAALQAQVAELRATLAAVEAENQRLTIFEQIVNQANDAVFRSDAGGKLIYANDAGAHMVGAESPATLMEAFGAGGGFSDPQEQQRLQSEILPKLLTEGKYQWTADVTRLDGTKFKGANSSFVLRDIAGNIDSVVAFVRDVSDQIQTEQRLIDSEAYLRAIIDNLPIVFFVLDRNGIFQISQGRALARIDLQPGQLVGASVYDVYAMLPDFLDAVRSAMSGTASEIETIDEERAIGLYSWLTPLHDGQGVSGVIGIAIDITERLLAERERMALQQNMIEGQRQALRELSTPLVPISDGVLAMPLVGTIDDGRAQQIMETLLEGIAAQQADVAILDITGVRVVDTQVADALLRVARAARLLGTRIILTGIGAEVAQTLVGLGADMSGLSTAATLQEGISDSLTGRLS